MIRALLVAGGLAGCGGAATPPVVAAEPKLVQLNAPGVSVDATAAVRDGYVTVVDFWSESCGACIVVGGMLAVQTADQPRVLVRKVNVGDGDNELARAYQIGALPHFNVYDTHKRLRYVLVGNDCLDAPTIARALLTEP